MEEQWGRGIPKRIAKQLGVDIGAYEDFREHAPRYKYLLNIDGVVSSWRLHNLLATGSVLLLQNSSSWEALHTLLVPWVHFAPIANDLSNLVSTVRWLELNPASARAMADAARSLFEARVRPNDVYCLALRSVAAFRTSELTVEFLKTRDFAEAPVAEAIGPKPVKRWLRTHQRLKDRLRSHSGLREEGQLADEL
eukprot:TRINITY_DN26588_c0_g1_i5.p1 TRINITY_DN26588_c0_g1~~TRINITY_DN26588_c0_g1_i5.p1  ORF type:complete len:195 (-),score=12.21 TRINITY_DN26588_c0_g1_i5:148-732(-)